MSGYRLQAPTGFATDRASPLKFRFNGKLLHGFRGDSLASALLANGINFIGRSFKYRRPRGISTCGPEESTGLLDVGTGDHCVANTRVTELPLYEGLSARTGNSWPSLAVDLAALTQVGAKAFSAGFYYKTFMWPHWHVFEPFIRSLAGLGHAGAGQDPHRYDEISVSAEVLVIGAGLAGLEAAAAAAESGWQVVLVEAEAWAGGWAATVAAGISAEALSLEDSVKSAIERARRAGVSIHLCTTVFGLYDHGLAVAIQLGNSGIRERTLKIRAARTILATGALDRPMLFPNNDRPGVMYAHAAERYAAHYGVAVGRRVAVATACDHGLSVARRLRDLGVNIVELLDRRNGACVERVHGVRAISAIDVAQADGSGRRRVEVDALVHVAGLTPNVSLHSQAGGGLRWDKHAAMFVPTRLSCGVSVVGACAGAFEICSAVEHSRNVGRGRATTAPVGGVGRVLADTMAPKQLLGRRSGPVFVDLQNDVLAADIELAARENYRSVEHMKRYTTAGMATDQGKSSNVNAIVLLGQATGRVPGDVGTTKFRPPYKPVTLGAIVAGRSGERYRPLRRMPAHEFHVARGAHFEEFGGWLRPAAYPSGSESIRQAAEREALHTRRGVGLFEGSPLGKIEVFGADAAAFLDLMYVGTMSSLPVGSARYGVLCNEHGIVVDDGIVARLAPQHFWVNTTSGGAERTALAFEEWLQCELPHLQVLVQPVLSQWGNVTVSGPNAWTLLEEVGFDSSLSPVLMKHMTFRETTYKGTRVRVLRASFSGELGYEINVPSLLTRSLICRLWDAGQGLGLDVGMYGIEALMLMRLEKGFIHVGADTDGTTMPQDIGFARAIVTKSGNFVGRRSLLQPAGRDGRRLQLVGLVAEDKHKSLPVGAHIAGGPPPGDVEGYVTSSGFSPTLQQSIALAMLQRGKDRTGDRVKVFHLGSEIAAKVVRTPFFDPAGERLNG